MMRRPLRADLLDLGVPCALALLAAAAVQMPGGSAVRLVLVLPALLFVPGHLLIAAATQPATRAAQRRMRAFLALGVSLPLVGALALATTLLPGGFRPGAIVAVVTVACLALAAAAALRRRMPRSGPRGRADALGMAVGAGGASPRDAPPARVPQLP